MPRPEVVPAGGLPLLIEEEGHVVSEAYRIRGDLMTGSKKGDPEADYLKAIELARLQGRACVPRPLFKFLIVAAVSFGLVGVAAAADLPHRSQFTSKPRLARCPSESLRSENLRSARLR
jgi:hypothetical protein